MNMDKYYTPRIGEFYVGFQYENFVKNIGWTKRTLESLNDQSANENGFLLDYDDYRVKYLDKEDIEACGWRRSPFKHSPVRIDSYNIRTIGTEYWKSGCRLIHYNMDNSVLILGDSNSSNIAIPSPKISTELKKLLEQLTITTV